MNWIFQCSANREKYSCCNLQLLYNSIGQKFITIKFIRDLIEMKRETSKKFLSKECYAYHPIFEVEEGRRPSYYHHLFFLRENQNRQIQVNNID